MSDQLALTPSQTIGPFLHIAFHDHTTRWAAPAGTPGLVTVTGVVSDGAGVPVHDAMVETWQCDGRFGRCETDDDGRYEIHTTIPPPVATRDGTAQAPHLAVSVFGRGLVDRVVTRAYFGDAAHAAANAADPTLGALGARAVTLVARPEPPSSADAVAPPRYRLDIRLQGDDETVFFDI